MIFTIYTKKRKGTLILESIVKTGTGVFSSGGTLVLGTEEITFDNGHFGWNLEGHQRFTLRDGKEVIGTLDIKNTYLAEVFESVNLCKKGWEVNDKTKSKTARPY